MTQRRAGDMAAARMTRHEATGRTAAQMKQHEAGDMAAADSRAAAQMKQREAGNTAAERVTQPEAGGMAAADCMTEERMMDVRVTQHEADSTAAERMTDVRVTQREAGVTAAERMTDVRVTQRDAGVTAAERVTQHEAGSMTAEQMMQRGADCMTAAQVKQREADCMTAAQVKQREADCMTAERVTQHEAGGMAAEQMMQHEAGDMMTKRMTHRRAGGRILLLLTIIFVITIQITTAQKTNTPGKPTTTITSTPGEPTTIITSTPGEPTTTITSTSGEPTTIITSTPGEPTTIITSAPGRTASVAATPGRVDSDIIIPGASDNVFDTIIVIPDVIVSASRQEQFRSDIRTDSFSSTELAAYAGRSLGQLLSRATPLNVRSYGSGGGVATISLRGVSSSQVLVSWNGFPINSVTAGSSDFSLLPVNGFDKISVAYGAPATLYGSGTFGGAVNLDNSLKPGESLSGSFSAGYESLQSLNGALSFTLGNERIAWRSNVWGTLSGNKFTYYDYIKQSERLQSDGRWHDAGTIQHLSLRLAPLSTLEAALWYQVKEYNIPSRIGSVSYESQRDSTLRLFTAFKTSGNRWGLQVKAAAFREAERYMQKPSATASFYSIDSRIRAEQYYGDANFRYFVRNGIMADAGITGSYITAKVSAYDKTRWESGLTAFAGVKYDRKGLILQGQLRKEWNSNVRSGLLSSLGVAVKVIPDRWTARANFSQKFRKPTFNDLFWMPGGNPELLPERGWSAEAGSAVTLFQGERGELSVDAGFYLIRLTDMISWRPAGIWWSAVNYRQVRSYGADGSLSYSFDSGLFSYHSSLRLMLNRSDIMGTDGETAEKMLYSPRIITSWEHRISYGSYDLTVNHNFTADRYYDEYSLLKPYQTIDLQAGISFRLWGGSKWEAKKAGRAGSGGSRANSGESDAAAGGSAGMAGRRGGWAAGETAAGGSAAGSSAESSAESSREAAGSSAESSAESSEGMAGRRGGWAAGGKAAAGSAESSREAAGSSAESSREAGGNSAAGGSSDAAVGSSAAAGEAGGKAMAGRRGGWAAVGNADGSEGMAGRRDGWAAGSREAGGNSAAGGSSDAAVGSSAAAGEAGGKAMAGVIGIHLGVTNVTGTTYELIRLYPMPRRYWSVRLSYTF